MAKEQKTYEGIHADVIVYIFARFHTALRTEGNMLNMNWLQAAKELV